MARIHPGHPERLLPYSQQYQEVRTLNRLQSGLPDTIAVYHSVHHDRMEGSRQRFGEIDFVNQAAIDLHEDTYQRQENKPYLQVAAVFTGQLGREQA